LGQTKGADYSAPFLYRRIPLLSSDLITECDRSVTTFLLPDEY
jgi:hypothetical protein